MRKVWLSVRMSVMAPPITHIYVVWNNMIPDSMATTGIVLLGSHCPDATEGGIDQLDRGTGYVL